jgi:hypothetical protein
LLCACADKPQRASSARGADTADDMTAQTTAARTNGRFRPLGLVFALLGVLLFAYYVWRADPRAIWQNMLDLGAGFLLVLLVSSARPLVRAAAWTRCFEAPYRVRLRDALRAYLAGDALGSVLPLGMLVSEPTKAAFVRDRVPLGAAVAAVAVENLFYSLSVSLFILAGLCALLLSFPLPPKLRLACAVGVGVVVVVILFGFLLVRRQWKFASRLLEFLYVRGVGRNWLESRRGRVAAVEARIYGFYERNRGRFLPILALEACFHLAGVVEVYTTLYFISTQARPTWLAAFVLESVNRIINVIFKFVPMRVGVDEAGTGLFTKALQFGTTSGVSLAIVRKARVIVWTAVGVVLLVRRGLSPTAIAAEAEQSFAPEKGITTEDGIVSSQ